MARRQIVTVSLSNAPSVGGTGLRGILLYLKDLTGLKYVGIISGRRERLSEKSEETERIEKSYPYVYSFLRRRGYVPVDGEVAALVDYVVRALNGEFDE